MRVINQWFALAGVVIAAGAGCATNEGEAQAPSEAGRPEVVAPAVTLGKLDAAAAAALDGKHAAAKARAFAVPGTCYSIDVMGSKVVHLDMHNEVATPVANLPSISGHDVKGMGHFGGSLVACQGGTELAVYDLDGTSAKSVPMNCDAVTGDGDHIWVKDPLFEFPPTIREYTSFAALVADQPSRTLPAPSAFSLGVGQNRLIAAWHSTNEVTLVSLIDGSHTTSPLQGYDNWIFGSAEAFGHRYMVGGWAEDSTGVHQFDPDTGAGQGRLFGDTWLAGLTCGTP